MRYMRLLEVWQLREELAKKHQWWTLKQIADGCKLSKGSVGRAFRGEAVWRQTVEAIAAALGRAPTDIAEFVQDPPDGDSTDL